MDSKKLPATLQEMLDISNPRAAYQNQFRLAKLKFDNARLLGYAGGQFEITAEIIGYLKHKLEADVTSSVVLDQSGMPILIEDVDDFLDIAFSQYHSALNEYYDEVSRLRKSRKVEVLLEAE